MEHYATLVFDCDGVVLNSNKVKTEAFYQATLPYGRAAAQAMVSYHIANGGVSRYKKFAHFLEKIMPKYVNRQGNDLEGLLQNYASLVRTGLLHCELTPSLKTLRQQTTARWMIVSGGDQTELRDVFAHRGIADWFDGGIFGSPQNKDEILASQIKSGSIMRPSIFLGDSKYDYQAASSAGLDFIFISAWTEVADWKEWVLANQINHRPFV